MRNQVLLSTVFILAASFQDAGGAQGPEFTPAGVLSDATAGAIATRSRFSTTSHLFDDKVPTLTQPTAVREFPFHPSHIGQKPRNLETFHVSNATGVQNRIDLGKAIIKALQRDAIINVATEGLLDANVVPNAYAEQKKFFDMNINKKMRCQNNLSYSGYVYSGEESTAGKQDAAEIFTITPDFSLTDPLVVQGMPCHGPVPWPSNSFEVAMAKYMDAMTHIGNVLMPLIALGLDMHEDSFVDLTDESWGHMRVLKFRDRDSTTNPGISSHTDYGMLVIATQDHVGGLWVRPKKQGEEVQNNWQKSSAGDHQNDDGWLFVVPEPGVVTVFPGDMLQLISRGKLLSTPHKVELADEVRYSIAFFHEPSFDAVIELPDQEEQVHYGTHFTNMFKRCYPHKPVTQRIVELELENNLVPERVFRFK